MWKCVKEQNWGAAKLALRTAFARTKTTRSLYFSMKRIAVLLDGRA